MHAVATSPPAPRDGATATAPRIESETGRPWLRAFGVGAGYWVVLHVFLVAVHFQSWLLGREPGPSLRDVLTSWVQWDGKGYVRIATQGYVVTDPTFQGLDDSTDVVWPPLYPILIRLFDFVLPGRAGIAAIAVANLAALALFVVLYRFLEQELSAKLAQRTLLCLVAFPTAFFLAMAYSESLFLFLSISALYLARRGNWWAAGAVGSLVGATRVVGVLIAVALAYEYLRQRDFKIRQVRLDVLSIALVPVGLGLYMLYCQQKFGNALIFKDAQAFWHRDAIVAPWQTMAKVVDLTFHGPNLPWQRANLIDAVSTVAVIVLLTLALVGPWKLRRDQFFLFLFGALIFLPGVIQPAWPDELQPLISVNRFALTALPMFIVLAKLTEHRFVRYGYLFAMIPIQAALMMFFISGEWAG